jgi:chorismate synthase
MPGNSFGKLFKLTTFGESHGGALGAVIDGCPSGIKIDKKEIQKELDRRKPGQSQITTPRKEEDQIEILSGVTEGKTTGTPILMLAYNKDVNSKDYDHLKEVYRPGHADFTYEKKYGLREWRGSGRASARETLARLAGGAIAKKYLKAKTKIEILSFVEQVGNISLGDEVEINDEYLNQVSIKEIEKNIIRCPKEKTAQKMINLIEEIKQKGDSIGGVIRGVIRNVPIGLGEPVFDKISADLAKAMMSIGATKGFETGLGFKVAEMKGSDHNDELFSQSKNKIGFKSNNAGGVLGGITNGESIHFRVAFKPVSTIGINQKTVTKKMQATNLKAHGRHDPCVLPRAVPVVDAMAALVLMDHYLRNKIYQ